MNELKLSRTESDKTHLERNHILILKDKLIDKFVYKLYGLTEEEIKIVEGHKINKR